METSVVAGWLSDFFGSYDDAVLCALHNLAEWAGTFVTPLMKGISMTGNKGILPVMLAALLLMFPKTRKVGICMLGALALGALVTNVLLKEWVARTRPYGNPRYYDWWRYVDAPKMRDFSFPSGHTTAATASMMCLWQCEKKRYFAAGCLYALLMGISRNYLMVHYPSDVLAAMLIGTLAAWVSCTVTDKVYPGRIE